MWLILFTSSLQFPIFNIADSYLTVSCILLLILGIFYYMEEDFDFVDGLFKKKRQNNREKNDSEQASESKENN